jgi:hypothetical protein
MDTLIASFHTPVFIASHQIFFCVISLSLLAIPSLFSVAAASSSVQPASYRTLDDWNILQITLDTMVNFPLCHSQKYWFFSVSGKFRELNFP